MNSLKIKALGMAMVGFQVFCFVAWVTSWVQAFRNGKPFWTVIDFLLFPIGVVDGTGIIFHWWQ